jgi:hypothetical protein
MTALDRLQQIIPPDQALANKALATSLQQINGVSTLATPQLATAAKAIQSTKNLAQVSNLTNAVPANTAAYFTGTLANGTGQNGTILIVDLLGTAIGWVHTSALTNSVTTMATMDLSSLAAVYNNMYNTVTGAYTQTIVNPSPPPTNLYQVVIPSGPGAGTYGDYTTAAAAINAAFSSGLIPAAQSIIAGLVSTYPTQTATLNTNWTNMGAQVAREKTLQTSANLDFTALQANSKTSMYSFVQSLPGYGLDTQAGGTAQFIEGVAQLTNFTGQSVVATLREGRNRQALNSAGIGTNAEVPVNPNTIPPQATLLSANYTEAEAAALVIK